MTSELIKKERDRIYNKYCADDKIECEGCKYYEDRDYKCIIHYLDMSFAHFTSKESKATKTGIKQ